MPPEITSKNEFTSKVKDAEKNQLLIFHSDNSSEARINDYYVNALEVAVENDEILEVYAVNIDQILLDQEDIDKYQCENQVICCTSIKEGEVRDKKRNPTNPGLRNMVLDIFS